MKKQLTFLVGVMLLCSLSFAQSDTSKRTFKPIPVSNARIVKPIELAGPRVGLTYVFPGKTADDLNNDLGVTPFFTQFGWQFEHQYFALDNGVAGLVEFVGLIGGLEQGKFLPSASVLIGVRGAQGGEFAFGPNLSLTGAGFVFAVGHTYKVGSLNFPVNFAVVPSTNGFRASALMGFNAQTR
jgi:hypothetical protein